MEVKINNSAIVTILSNSNYEFTTNKLGKDELFEAICAWQAVIYQLVDERLSACKNSLLANLSGIDSANDYIVCYHTKNGNNKHYSAPAAQAMQLILDNILENPSKIVDDHMCLLQISKALYWADSFDRSLIKDGYTFDNLYSLILDRLILK